MKTSTTTTYLTFAVLVLASLEFSPQAQAINPLPDGGYPNGNTAEGTDALFLLTTGSNNTAVGKGALADNMTGDGNTATGFEALRSNTGGSNTAIGYQALSRNTVGFFNIATGPDALLFNTTGTSNIAIGVNALFENTTASKNIAIGVDTLFYNNGSSNTAIGNYAMQRSTTGKHNAALGYQAGQYLTTGNGNVCIGADVGGVAGESNTTRIRNIYATVASGRAVYINSDDKIGTLASSRRYKEQIKPMDKASEAILALKPVTFRYKKEVDPARSLGFGLIAEEVAEVNAELVTCDANGKPETVRYEVVNAMLLNEFLKEHRTVQDLKSTVAKQEATIAQQQRSFQCKLAEQEKQIEALTSGLQKVSAQLEVSKPARQTVLNNH